MALGRASGGFPWSQLNANASEPRPLKTDVYSALFLGECVRLLAHVCVCVCVLSARIQLGSQHNRVSKEVHPRIIDRRFGLIVYYYVVNINPTLKHYFES